jgi:hypothetical protein
MKRNWTQEEIEFLKNNYPNKGSNYCSIHLNRKINSIHSKCSLLKIKLTKDYIKIHNQEVQRKRNEKKLNSDFNVNLEQFLNVTSPNVSYFLGYLWADGYIVRQEIRLSILKSDMDVIKPVLDKIGKWNYNERQRDNRSLICTAITNNKRLVDFLIENDFKIKSGASADKILNKINDSVKHYFFRGLVDGDGSINNKRLSISSNYTQDWSYVTKLANKLDLKTYIYRIISEKNKYSVIEMNGINGLLFGNYIYKNIDLDNIGLKRKYIKYLELKDRINNSKTSLLKNKKETSINLYKNGKSISDIVKEIGISKTTLRRFINNKYTTL